MDSKNYTPWLRYLGVTAQLLVLIGLGVFAGIKLDEKFDISPLLTVALPLLVLAATFYKLIKETGKRNKNDGRE
ncbi:AtpZ/AtpI family protein [Niabella ginsengisoli]|uniref:AtpZ/AtpI family protein n=1 Tax=Niabella ginsengisoli TaxID=522298 RepID=A0ABS9SQZ9_9BACT|nr:AtpZ/AtpI family protein [Niabella ginsengisoli]MCH5600686.1 AtpZ/AtpI family protein [Niabella ginsengisoli]